MTPEEMYNEAWDNFVKAAELPPGSEASEFLRIAWVNSIRATALQERTACASEARWVAEEHFEDTKGKAVALEIEQRILARSNASSAPQAD